MDILQRQQQSLRVGLPVVRYKFEFTVSQHALGAVMSSTAVRTWL